MTATLDIEPGWQEIVWVYSRDGAVLGNDIAEILDVEWEGTDLADTECTPCPEGKVRDSTTPECSPCRYEFAVCTDTFLRFKHQNVITPCAGPDLNCR
jgi:hypothetical protein